MANNENTISTYCGNYEGDHTNCPSSVECSLVDMSTIPHLWDYDEDAETDKFGFEAEYRAEMDSDWWSPVEQGMYDDDPSPYSGDYSEM